MLYVPTVPSSVFEVEKDLPAAARALKLTLQPCKVRAGDDFEQVFAEAKDIDFLLLGTGGAMGRPAKPIIEIF